jgi:uncharacterized protein (DUF58 family)
VAAATYLAARIVGTWELYLVSLSFLATLLVSWLVVLATGRKLTATRTLWPGQPAAGDDVVVTVRVTNGSQLPGLQVTLPDATGDLSAHPQTIELASLGPFQERAATSAARPARRGIHHLPALWVDAEDSLGLVHTRRRLGDPLRVTVYPRLVDLRSCVLFADIGARRDIGRRGFVRLGASEFRGIRPHNPGEPLSHIDWKATAKTGNLMLREMDDPTSGDIAVLLDGTAAQVVGEDESSNFELALQAAGSVAEFVLGAGRGVDLLVHDGRWRQTRLAPDFNGHHLLLDTLAEARPDARSPLPASLQRLRSSGGRLARTQVLTLVALSLDRELVRALIALRREGLGVSVIHVVAGSFAPGAANAPGGEKPDLLVALAAAGVVCLSLERGDDLRSTLSLPQTQSSLLAPLR